MVTIPYKNPYRMAPGATRHKRHIVVLVETDEGITGVGETGVTLVERGGGTQEAIYIPIRKYFAPLILAMDPCESDASSTSWRASIRAAPDSRARKRI